ncbi:MAG: hypothetical protein JWO95_3014 [Verrucomicrobiales bacterium]|nr:hypothetical protein [Verrucomicrobiales bacterium]
MKIIKWSAIGLCAGLMLVVSATPVRAKGHARATTKVAYAAPKPVKKGKLSFPPVGSVPVNVSPEAAEVVWLFHHGFRNEELLHYVNKSHADFALSVEDFNYLKDVGISTDVAVAMLRSPATRENFVRLEQASPIWAAIREPSQHPTKGQAASHHSPGKADVQQVRETDLNQENVPNVYGPTDNTPEPQRFQGFPYGMPRPGYGNDFYNRAPRPGFGGFNGHNGSGGYGSYDRYGAGARW